MTRPNYYSALLTRLNLLQLRNSLADHISLFLPQQEENISRITNYPCGTAKAEIWLSTKIIYVLKLLRQTD